MKTQIDKVNINKLPRLIEGAIIEKEMYVKQMRALNQDVKVIQKKIKGLKRHVCEFDRIIEHGVLRLINENKFRILKSNKIKARNNAGN